jgi:acyl dehydratase/ribosomal protein S27AE
VSSPTAPSQKADSSADASPSAGPEDLDRYLQSFVGLSSGPGLKGADPVNLPMIRHWVEAMGDRNPVYVDDDAARRAGFDGIIAPPTMLQAWIMRGLRASQEADQARATRGVESDSPTDKLMGALDQAGFTSVVATNCDQHYVRPLVPGDHLEVNSVIDSVSAEKRTGLGIGHFITTRLEYTDQKGDLVATMLFRILKFKPRPRPNVSDATGGDSATKGDSATAADTPARPQRPRPALTQDNRFFFEGAKQHKLLIQRCTNCGMLRHPPRPACANCRSFEWEAITASGRGTIYSYVPSTIRWWWCWSNSKREPAWWPTWSISPRRRWPSACR